MIEHSTDIAKLSAALVGAQGKMSGAKRDSTNPHFRSSYASLETVIEAAKPALQEFGIAFIQAPGQLADGALEVSTMLIHGESGQWVRSTLHVPIVKRDPQGVGSAITYACRYSLMAMLGLPATDDDGEASTTRDDKPEKRESTSKPASGRDDKPITAAAMKSGLAAIDNELTECRSIDDVNTCAKTWAAIMNRDDWTKEYREKAALKFQARRAALTPAEDVFPGDEPTKTRAPSRGERNAYVDAYRAD